MRYDYLVVDVFSSKQFGGNQLAILLDATGITAEGMQLITREFNYPETTFVLPSADPNCVRRVRIFTPGGEVPFAGHPTVGTACALFMKGICALGEVRLEEGIGVVPVVVEQNSGVLSGTLSLDRGPELSDDVPPAQDIALALGIAAEDVRGAFCASSGIRFTFIELSDRDAVDRASLNESKWRRAFADRWAAQLYFYSGELDNDGELYARMFAPALGVPEDPATGSAVAALVGATVVREGRSAPSLRLRVLQGVKMGRPSVIHAFARAEGGEVQTIEVAGASTFVAEGQISVPGEYLDA
jgi:trans-2,3-dihydro-3-hydroxyanthranilate isomerase